MATHILDSDQPLHLNLPYANPESQIFSQEVVFEVRLEQEEENKLAQISGNSSVINTSVSGIIFNDLLKHSRRSSLNLKTELIAEAGQSSTLRVTIPSLTSDQIDMFRGSFGYLEFRYLEQSFLRLLSIFDEGNKGEKVAIVFKRNKSFFA